MTLGAITIQQELQQNESSSLILPTNLVDRKTVVLKPRFDHTIVDLLAEKLKYKVFSRMGFFKMKASEVQIKSVEEYYDQYLIFAGKYSINYYKPLVFSALVNGDAKEIFLLKEKIKIEQSIDLFNSDYKIIRLTGVASYHYENRVRCALELWTTGFREVDIKKYGSILDEGWPEENLSKVNPEFSEVKISLEEEVRFFQSRVVQRPPDVGEVIRETLEVNERTIIYSPVYRLTFENRKTGKEAIVKIDGITGNIDLVTFNKSISGKVVEDIIKSHSQIISPIVPDQVTVEDNLSVVDASQRARAEIVDNPKKTSKSKQQVSKTLEADDNLKFPAQVTGQVFHVGDKVVAIVGDLEIPSGITIVETLVVKGKLIIGEDCEILGSIKALGNIIIGARTIVWGNVVSGQNVTLGRDVEILGKVAAEKMVHSEPAVAEGNLDG